MSRYQYENQWLSRRSLLKALGLTPLVLRAAPFYGITFPAALNDHGGLPFEDIRLHPAYPARSPLEEVLRLVEPGTDEYITEKYAFEIEALLQQWSLGLKVSANDLSALAKLLDPALQATLLVPPAAEVKVRADDEGLDCIRRHFGKEVVQGRDRFLEQIRAWLGQPSRVEIAEFAITDIAEVNAAPLTVRAAIRYDVVLRHGSDSSQERVGTWTTEWSHDQSAGWQVRRWEADEERLATVRGPVFMDVTSRAMSGSSSYQNQLLRGSDYWRTVLDGACGIDVYGNNGVAVGDFDNDGLDDLYVCQPSGLPNRLYRNRGDGTLEDVTEKAGVGVLDNTACALFADFENKGRQDLLVVCGSGPLLFINQGDGTFLIKRDAFQFKTPPQGTFTHASIADYDRDGRLDVYLCVYSYYLGLDQYHYPVPYFDARNGPPNFLFHNEGNATFVDKTEAAGLNAENDRYSFACAWGDSSGSGLPDLYVANDFGRSNLYRNNGDGTFVAISSQEHVDDAGAGMSASWADFNNDGRQDIYAANMWSAAGQRVSAQKRFHEKDAESIRALYRRHARGNSLYRNEGEGKFQNISGPAGAEMGRWSWCSDFFDFDHDGYPDLYVANGYISAAEQAAGRSDLGSFFWRQVVGKSPADTTPSLGYEHGWNALNELIRSDRSWSGFERNVLFANNHDGTFTEVSGPAGLDFPEDGRSFALADLDHDGRLEVILKNRNAPQLRILHNEMKKLGSSIVFRLRGQKSNRDAIGAAITVEAGSLRQTKYLQAGSGFLAQHSKEVFFGVGKTQGPVRVTLTWPSGLSQKFESVPVDRRIEIEEGSSVFVAKPFAATPPAWSNAGAPPKVELLPEQIETWLLEPLKAPEFSLPDATGKMHSLSSVRGAFTLLNFWAVSAPLCHQQLKALNQHARSLQILAIHVGDPAETQAAKSLATEEKLLFPVLFATEDIAGVYNIIYRYLFDRRRDLAIPSSFLLDREGMIMKVYQGPMEPQQVLHDVRSAPETPDQRRLKALPFAGTVYQGAFQRNDFTYGVALFQHGYLDQAAESFQQVIAAKPDDPEGYYNLGTLNLRRNDLQQARSYLEQTLRLKPNYPEAWNNLGMIAAQQGQPEEAVKDFQQSLLLRPGYATALLNLGNIYRREKLYSQAQDLLNQALAAQPDDPEVNYSLGMLYAQQGQMQQAGDYLQRAVELRPDYPEALNNLGVLYVRTQDYAKAEEQFRRCIRLVPGFDQSYMNLARLYMLRNDKQGAREALQQLLKLQPENPNAKRALEMLQ